MVFVAGLVLRERLLILVETQERKVVALASLDGVGDRGTADHQPLVLDAGQFLELLELRDELLFVFLRDVGPELEENLWLFNSSVGGGQQGPGPVGISTHLCAQVSSCPSKCCSNSLLWYPELRRRAR